MHPRIDTLPHGLYHLKIAMGPAARSQRDKYRRGEHSFPAKSLWITLSRGRGAEKIHRRAADEFEGPASD